MAENNDSTPQAPDVDAGALFRAEMALTNFFMGYWPHILGTMAVVLIAFFVYGEYDKRYKRAQRGYSASISKIVAKAPNGFGEPSQTDKDNFKSSADEIVGVADGFVGTARVEALLKAAEWYRLADAQDPRRSALEAAVKDAEGPLNYSAAAALANLDIEQGNEEAAVSRLQKLIEGGGFYAQQASIDLGFAYEHFGKNDDARALYESFLEQWPDVPAAEDVRGRLGRLGTQG